MGPEDHDLRIFTEGSTKSHVYCAGDERAICGAQKLRARDSAELPEFEGPELHHDLCKKCKETLENGVAFWASK